METNSKNLSSFHKRANSIQEQNSKRKSFEELSLMDAFLFDAATEKDENAIVIAKVIIERTTGRKVKKLVVQTQKELKGVNLDKHGIRMDVYTTEIDDLADSDEITCVYDIEPNNYEEKALARRNRFYQSLIDSKLLPPETPYSALPDMISIWILPYDPFGDDRMIYTVKNIVTENNQIVYNDGVTKIFLYTKGTKGGSKALKELLTFMENPTYNNAVDKELSEILNIVNTIKMNPEERGRYMGLMSVIDYEKRDSYEEGHSTGYRSGLEKGEIKGAIETYKDLKTDKGMVKTAIMNRFSLTEEKAEEYLNLYW